MAISWRSANRILRAACPSSVLFSEHFCSCLRQMFITVLNITSVVLSVPKRIVGISANHITRRNSKSAVEKRGKTGERWDLLLVEDSGGKFSDNRRAFQCKAKAIMKKPSRTTVNCSIIHVIFFLVILLFVISNRQCGDWVLLKVKAQNWSSLCFGVVQPNLMIRGTNRNSG